MEFGDDLYLDQGSSKSILKMDSSNFIKTSTFVSKSEILISNSQYSSNTLAEEGGAIHSKNCRAFSIISTPFKNLKAGKGAGVYLQTDTLLKADSIPSSLNFIV